MYSESIFWIFSFGGNFDQNLKGEDSEDQRIEGMENGFVASCEILVGLNSNGYAGEKDGEEDEPLKRFAFGNGRAE